MPPKGATWDKVHGVWVTPLPPGQALLRPMMARGATPPPAPRVAVPTPMGRANVAPCVDGGLGLGAPVTPPQLGPPIPVTFTKPLGPAAKAAAASMRAQKKRSAAWTWGCRLAWQPFKFAKASISMVLSAWLGIALLLTVPALVPPVVKTLQSFSDLSHEATAAAGAMLQLGTNFTTSATSLMLDVGNGGKSLAHEFWRGIDLLNVTLWREAGTVVVDDGSGLAAWLELSSSAGALAADPDFRSWVTLAAAGVEVSRPYVAVQHQNLSVQGSYVEYRVQARLLDSGYVDVQWERAAVTFVPTWSNILWALAEMDPQTEGEAVQQRLSLSLEVLRNSSSWAALGKVELEEERVPLLLGSRLRRLWRWARLSARRYASHVLWPLW